MIIYLKKFGTILNGRQYGREAFLAFRSSLKEINKEEEIIVDFKGVTTFTPSWGDEFLGSLVRKLNKKLILINTDNPSVKATIETLKNYYGDKLKVG